ncbi:MULTISPECIES: HAD family hydrolase [unclassified Rhodanobacter]|uniref:HAD family hydrolase n=1 Tax=unclassified Rhodanobacter TaxID=2621553 RepID=UPI001BDED91B|nr:MULTISPECIES: HAD family hydrolase [unclassified Rhodanobacter]MBT2144186.1 HAD family hydrolase [Rhodanobacter sp. LX-99]MBT2150147.1 HAD family hydrolase [Rhodanobacter sp. LX-100]
MLSNHASEAAAVVFLLDVDNTLLDNDRFGADLGDTLEAAFGAAGRARYWAIYEELRQQSGFADYLGALQRFRTGLDNDPSLLQMSNYLLDYPFADRLYPHALETVAHLRTLGPTAILSDGDVVFQPRKIQRAGLWAALRGEVLIYVHKQQMLVAMQQRYPAAHYVMVDDKPHVLAAMKQRLGHKLTTVFVRQGHYAADSAGETIDPAADLTIACIGDLRERKLGDFLPSAPAIPLPAS